MLGAIFDLFLWLPGPIKAIVTGVILVFLLVSLLRLIKLILDAIPFL